MSRHPREACPREGGERGTTPPAEYLEAVDSHFRRNDDETPEESIAKPTGGLTVVAAIPSDAKAMPRGPAARWPDVIDRKGVDAIMP